MEPQKSIRVLMAKAGLDAHQRGLMNVSMGLKDNGMEVIYIGLRQTPDAVVKTAIEESVDVIGISSLSGGHISFVRKVIQKAEENGLNLSGILLLVGGIIPEDDVKTLKQMGVNETFGPGTPIKKISDYIRRNLSSPSGQGGS